MAKNKKTSGSTSKNVSPDELMVAIIARMESCSTAEALNDDVIMPFILALEKVCESRGYLMNIYGEQSNIAITNPDDAETIYHLIEEYLDAVAQD